ncbi:DNA-binding protein [Leptothermofonsia sichuanensis E412]|uniref:helix-hairpin-helix domain-containing protein n=1 Tax=Leptothermofonsia sichuanensis TaxID=2917832 RepID=UPI001CA6B081|nr:helix-hairpin-helix domain-containing protein [Leptothermofonsia sichuanensis]QZZ21221.1 DNA-binding protein [Leptothermofonsia sichuanensis E412]
MEVITSNATTSTNGLKLSNDQISDVLDQVADLLEFQEASRYRVQAYRNAAHRVRSLNPPLSDLYSREGKAGLEKLPGIGKSLSAALEELFQTGQLQLLNSLQAEVPPEALFTTIPGIGEKLAHQLHQELGIATLEELELAAHDGRLEHLKGFGDRRVRLIRQTLATILNRASRRHAQTRHWQEEQNSPVLPNPPIELLLEVDARYRNLAETGQLRTIAPRRFNPDNKRWLPIMNWQHDGWSFTAMYSNTALAHELGKTHDWVVIFYEKNGYESQCTVVTETRGRMMGKRVVRGQIHS